MCAGKQVVKTNSLAYLHPGLAQQWYMTKNGNLTAETVYASSHRAVWWQCSTVSDHVWSAKIVDRLQNEAFPCPFCSHRRLHPTNSLAALYPDLVAQWHPSKNGTATPDRVIAGSGEYAWWKCPNGPDHEWSAQIYSRMTGVGCPFCAGRNVSESNALAVLYPDLAAQWHPTQNGARTPDQVVIGSQQQVWWKCPKGPDHEWRTSVAKRTKDKRGCPCCSGRKVSITNCVATVHPALAKEWHPTKNGTLTPEQVVAGSEKKIWWQCSINPLHEWPAMAADRVRGSGCPSCGHGWTLERIRVFVQAIQQHIQTFTSAELYLLFQQNGLLTPKAAYRGFIRALATGRFPQKELEKFAQEEPSLVDMFFSDPQYTLEAYQRGGEESYEDELPVNIFPEIQDDHHLALDSQTLPLVEASDVLDALSSRVISSSDEEAVEFLTTSAVAKLWKHAFHDAGTAVSQARAFHGDTYAETVAQRFLHEYDTVQSLAIPEGYAFQVNGQQALPNLMQRLVVVRLLQQKRIGNWSGTGAGKTLSAILASRVTHARFTLICCPNSVVDAWASSIRAVFPDSIVATKTLTPDWSTLCKETPECGERTTQPKYLVVNYEAFQQLGSAATVQALLSNESLDFIVIDEIHYAKQRQVEDMTRRRQLIMALVSEAGKKNADLYILALSATPVINNLQEGKSMLELVTGLAHDDIGTTATVANCMSLHQKLVQRGIRWMPEYDLEYDQLEIPVDCSMYLGDIRTQRNTGSVLQLEQILTRARLPVIREHIKPKTLIYSHLIQGIDKLLYEGLIQDGWRVGFYTGEEKSGLKQFIDGDVDVLIGSSAISTGIDRLQHVCNHLIINVLPWTHAEFEQLKGRLYRQGQAQHKVTMVIPLTSAQVNGEDWSWCESKLQRLRFKKSVADAAIDGVVPEGHLRTPAQAYQDVMRWLERLEAGNVVEVSRAPAYIPPISENDLDASHTRYGDFSSMNRLWNQAKSETTHVRLAAHPEEWAAYHAHYREARKEWTIVPFEEMLQWLKKRQGYVVGDFGCGEAQIAETLSGTHIVYSFDHVAINEQVIACDIAHVPLEDEILDVAVFSLSLMGANFTEYLREARRTLKLDGHLHIYEATSRFTDRASFCKGLQALGFDVLKVEDIWKFTHIHVIKSDRHSSDECLLTF